MSQLRDNVEYTSSWVREPQGRGTLSILYTCTFTLILCVYTAVHLNIPPAGEPRRWQILRKIKWMFIAIFAPEAVLFTAMYQFWSAWAFCREMDKLRADLGGGTAVKKKKKKTWWWENRAGNSTSGDEENGATPANASTPQSPEPFSITYGFYVVMGGLTVDVSDMHNDIKTVTLTPYYVLERARILKDWKPFVVSDTIIDDKSKADTLAKLLVVLQVSWLFLQCVTRASQGMPLTILEVHTLVHAACAMLMYGLWFNKPLDIRDATVVNLPGCTNQLALHLMEISGSITISSAKDNLRLMPKNIRFVTRLFSQIDHPSLRILVGMLPNLAETQAMCFERSLRQMENDETVFEQQDYDVFDRPQPGEAKDSGPVAPHHEPTGHQGGDYVCTLLPNQYLRCGWYMQESITWEDDGWDIMSYSLTSKDILRLKRAANESLDKSPRMFIDLEPKQMILKTEATISIRSNNFSWHELEGGLEGNFRDILYIVGLGGIVTVYGAIHLALWNFAFPSRTEMLLWKISGCTMAVPLAICIGVVMFSLVFMVLEVHGEMRAILMALGGFFFFGAYVLLYIFARVFIVLESFLSLRMVPVGVYEGLTWADYIPHI